jgi:hypothetical protein
VSSPARRFRSSGAGPEAACLGADLRGDVGVGDQVVIPVGIGRLARFGREDGDAAVAKILVHHRLDSFLAASGANGIEQQERRSGEVAAHLSAVGAELLDGLAVPVVT